METKISNFGKLIYLVPKSCRSWISKIPILAYAQRVFIKYLGPKGEFLHKIDNGPAQGLILPIRLPQDKSMWKGTYEINFCENLKESVKPGFICFDVGAYHGYTAGVLALAGSKLVYAFEPMPDNQKCISKMLELNPNLPISLISKAASDDNGKQFLVINKDPSMNKLICDNALTESETINVETVTLDNFAETSGFFPDLIKIDVEGAEEAVLNGAINVLKKNVQKVFLEIHNQDAENACLKILKQLGFAPIWQEKKWGEFANQVMFNKNNSR